jgi:hypothetical protein
MHAAHGLRERLAQGPEPVLSDRTSIPSGPRLRREFRNAACRHTYSLSTSRGNVNRTQYNYPPEACAKNAGN